MEEGERRLHAPQGERERVLRGTIEPLDVVDCEHERRPVRGEELQGGGDGDAERARIHGILGLLEEEHRLQRTAPRRRQRRQELVQDGL